MSYTRRRTPFGLIGYIGLTFVLGVYFTFASVQGDFGLMRRLEIDAEANRLAAELAALEAQTAQYRNKTMRLSDAYLDLDLLDEQARDILGYVRADEVILR
jgi:cell division protein FtsB